LLPEALEAWPEALFRRVLPRHLEIIFEINRRFLDEARMRYIGDDERVRRMSLIDEAGGRSVRMAHLACVGSFAVNGVARLHTELLKRTVLSDFAGMWPEKFSSKTNGVSPRRFVALANPGLTRLLDVVVGGEWLRDLERLRALEPLADDASFHDARRAAKREAKSYLTTWLAEHVGFAADLSTLFDVQVKRMHEYKRRLLNVLHILSLYARIKHDRSFAPPPRTFVFGGKAAPGYRMAKLIVKLINAVGEDNFFLFGLTAAEAAGTLAAGRRPRDLYEADPLLREAVDLLASGLFSHGDRGLFRPLVDNLLDRDPFLVLGDFRSYAECQEAVSRCWVDRRAWTRKSILNVARIGRFSSDRAIREYCDDIWKVKPPGDGPAA